MVGWVEKWRLKLTPAKVEVEVEAELGNKQVGDKIVCELCLSVLVESIADTHCTK